MRARQKRTQIHALFAQSRVNEALAVTGSVRQFIHHRAKHFTLLQTQRALMSEALSEQRAVCRAADLERFGETENIVVCGAQSHVDLALIIGQQSLLHR
jgi:hypothetical protein